MALGNAIRKRRKALHMTLQELARRVNANSGNLSRIERGAQGVSESMLRKLCAALDCTAAHLYAQSEAESGNSTNTSRLTLHQPQEFVRWFRAAAPYIHAFGGRTFVIAFGGEVVDDGQFVALSHDLNLLASLEVRLVLVHGVRPQIDSRLRRAKLQNKLVNGLRVTDDEVMEAVKEANGAVRVEIESLLSMGLINSPMAGADIRVASGNFVTAKPLGVREGIDLQHTGEVRKVDAIGIQKRLDDGELVLLSPLGYSPTGEVFNLTLEDVATSAAIALDADKLIFLMDSNGVHNIRGELLREMTTDKARNLLRHIGDNVTQQITEDEFYYLPAAVRACGQGVARTHLISRHVDGAILQELFTHDGIGTMVTEDSLEAMRPADIGDVGGILQLIEPLENEGILVRRGRERLEMEIDRFHVMEHDGKIIGCAALYPFPTEKTAELACMAIHTAFRRGGRGDRLLTYCEEQARGLGMQSVFVLTTRTEHWFLERGFTETDVEKLPGEKQKLYNLQRRSKVFSKRL
ncbi:transcriptional regulator, XRE family /N-acetylglutamate kinase /N-acetylglutamate synthase [Methylobacillus rhizosphaerae]|uniref:Amino-acid acetyltransferase n=1 Tax=Methylobacillus rhizosphaerae TaxID=551994 RepID=A0A238Y0Q1_9PROT|nr:amino-acid N-acetyltransferase [Methylobacillus rhizosphaerae]SNR64184.1 transcriptional regulator, XRE family /N-acetylglutamate kinase /N-acetylglutamate synthase [Methylobacillus rhizosphaerae]